MRRLDPELIKQSARCPWCWPRPGARTVVGAPIRQSDGRSDHTVNHGNRTQENLEIQPGGV